MLAQIEGPEGGGGAAVQLLKSPCDSELVSSSRRRSTVVPDPKHYSLSRIPQTRAGGGRFWFSCAARGLGVQSELSRRQVPEGLRRDPGVSEIGRAARRSEISVSIGAIERGVMNGFTPEEMSRGGDAAAAVAAVVAAAAAASAGNGAAAGAGAEVPGAVAVSAAGPPGAAGPGPGQLCCLREDGERCGRAAGNASFSKRIQKSISQKKVKIELDKSVSDGGTALHCPPP